MHQACSAPYPSKYTFGICSAWVLPRDGVGSCLSGSTTYWWQLYNGWHVADDVPKGVLQPCMGWAATRVTADHKWCPEKCVFACLNRLKEEEEGPAVDAAGNRYMTIEELKRQDAERRAGAT